jgi:hypothetical protein
MRRHLVKVDLGRAPDRLSGVTEFHGNRYPVDRDVRRAEYCAQVRAVLVQLVSAGSRGFK